MAEICESNCGIHQWLPGPSILSEVLSLIYVRILNVFKMYKWREGKAVKLLGFFNYSMCIFYWSILIYSVSCIDLQQRDSGIHAYRPIFFKILFLYRLLQNTEYSSLCYTVGPCWLSVLYTTCISINPKLQICPSFTCFPLW